MASAFPSFGMKASAPLSMRHRARRLAAIVLLIAQAAGGRERPRRLNRVGAALAGADADRLIDRRDKDLAVADPAGVGGLLDRLDRALDQRLLHHDLDLHLWQKIDDVLGPAIELGVPLLPSETLGLGDGDTLDADFVKRLLHLVELEGFDDRLDLLHRILISLNPRQRPRQSPKHNLCHPPARWGWLALTRHQPKFCSSRGISGRQIAEQLADPLDRLADRLAAVGIRKAQIAFAELAEAGACDRRHPGFFQELCLQCPGVEPGTGHVGESVERATRLHAAKPRQAIERRNDHFAALGKRSHHAMDRLARTLQRGDAGELGGRVDAGMAVDREPLGRAEQRLWPDPIAEPPAGHRIGLAPPVEQNHPVADRGVAEQADMLGAIIEDLAVDLVAEHGDLGMALEPGDQPVELAARHDSTGRVGRAVDDQEPRPRGDFVEYFLGAERKAGAFVQRDRHRGGAGETDYALVDREARVRIEDLDPRLAEHQDGKEHRDLAARNDEHEVGGDLDTVAAEEVGRHRGAQRRDAVGWGVAVMAVGERLAAGLDDVFRGREIGLADPEIDDRAALCGERVGARQHLERGLGSESAHAPGHLQHSLLRDGWPHRRALGLGSRDEKQRKIVVALRYGPDLPSHRHYISVVYDRTSTTCETTESASPINESAPRYQRKLHSKNNTDGGANASRRVSPKPPAAAAA